VATPNLLAGHEIQRQAPARWAATRSVAGAPGDDLPRPTGRGTADSRHSTGSTTPKESSWAPASASATSWPASCMAPRSAGTFTCSTNTPRHRVRRRDRRPDRGRTDRLEGDPRGPRCRLHQLVWWAKADRLVCVCGLVVRSLDRLAAEPPRPAHLVSGADRRREDRRRRQPLSGRLAGVRAVHPRKHDLAEAHRASRRHQTCLWSRPSVVPDTAIREIPARARRARRRRHRPVAQLPPQTGSVVSGRAAIRSARW
jgi:hypothetical protein